MLANIFSFYEFSVYSVDSVLSFTIVFNVYEVQLI